MKEEGRDILKLIFCFAEVIAQGLNTSAVRVTKKTGVYMFHHFSKDIEPLIEISFDHVITVCSHAKQLCQKFFEKTHVTHVSFDAPPSLAKFAKSEEEVLSHLRRVRDDHARPSGADVVHGQMITATLIHHAASKVQLAAGVTSLFSDCGGGAHGCRVCMDRNGAALAEPTSPCQS